MERAEMERAERLCVCSVEEDEYNETTTTISM